MDTEKEIFVLLPIRVTNSEFCFHKEHGFRCQYFSSLLGCYHGFNPERISDTIYEKDSECRELLWQDSIK